MRKISTIIYSEPRKTFMEIMKVHNSEVHFANLLAFFLRPKESHKLGTYFLTTFLKTNCHQILGKRESRSLIDVHSELYSNPENLKAKDVQVKVEVRTAKNNRIDILIIAPEFVICIDFKINHDLNNPLQDYCDYVNKTYPKKNISSLYLHPIEKPLLVLQVLTSRTEMSSGRSYWAIFLIK